MTTTLFLYNEAVQRKIAARGRLQLAKIHKADAELEFARAKAEAVNAGALPSGTNDMLRKLSIESFRVDLQEKISRASDRVIAAQYEVDVERDKINYYRAVLAAEGAQVDGYDEE